MDIHFRYTSKVCSSILTGWLVFPSLLARDSYFLVNRIVLHDELPSGCHIGPRLFDDQRASTGADV